MKKKPEESVLPPGQGMVLLIKPIETGRPADCLASAKLPTDRLTDTKAKNSTPTGRPADLQASEQSASL